MSKLAARASPQTNPITPEPIATTVGRSQVCSSCPLEKSIVCFVAAGLFRSNCR